MEVIPTTAEAILGVLPKIPTIEQRIGEIAGKLCKDYPNISTVPAYEQLWAIEQGFLGCQAANDDWHNLVSLLKVKYNIPQEEITEAWKGFLCSRRD